MQRLPLLLTILCLPGLAFGTGELVRSKSELKSLSTRIEALMADMAEDTSTADNITRDLDRLDQNKAALNRRIRQSEVEAGSLDDALADLRKEAETLDGDLATVRDGLSALLRSRYMLRDTSPLRVLLDQQDPQSAARRLTMFRCLVDSGNRELANLERLAEAVRRNREETSIKQQALATVRESLESDRVALSRDEAAYRERLASVREKLAQSESRIALYREREVALQRLIAELSRPRPAPRPVEAVPQPDERNQSGAAAKPRSETVTRPPRLAQVPGGFARQKGRLALPLASPLSARFGQRREDSGLKWEGLLFDSQEGEPVHAIFPGQVVFSDWFRGYGQLMVVDHGEGYMSLYGHNRELGATVGELVEAGQVIARAAAAGQPPVPGVYFEIRHNGSPDDPLKWCR